jgi:hypothetical protein
MAVQNLRKIAERVRAAHWDRNNAITASALSVVLPGNGVAIRLGRCVAPEIVAACFAAQAIKFAPGRAVASRLRSAAPTAARLE